MDDPKYIASKLEMEGIAQMPKVLQMLRDSSLSDLCYAYKIRTKSEKKLIEKVERKKENCISYSLADITDIVGLRLVALFRAEMVEIFNGILTAITHSNGINPNPFVNGPPKEIIIYKGSSNVYDELPARLNEIAAKLCPNCIIKEEHSKEGYSSIHLVTYLAKTPEISLPNDYKIPIEIQIRSVFEDAWGEIDHKFGYITRSGKNLGKPINNPEFVLAHLKVLKRFSDACMEYADVIWSEAIGEPTSLTATRKVVPVASDNDIVHRFKTLNIPPDILEKYCSIREIKNKAEARSDRDPSEAKVLYLDAAEQFRNLAHDLGNLKESEENKLIHYYLRMNEAVCLMSTNVRDQVIAAHGIYQNLENKYSNFPLLKMRLGQALGKLGHLDDALLRLREAGSSAEGIASEYSHKKESDWPDYLPRTDYEHIIRNQPKLLGYHIWLKIQSLATQQENEKNSLFKEAYEVTKKGLKDVITDTKQTLSMHNNLLYYALGCLTRADTDKDRAIFNQQLTEHLSYIENHISYNYTLLTITHADTVMKAYEVLGRKKDAIKVAEILVDKCFNQQTPELNPDETLKLGKYAYQVSKGQGSTMID